MDYKFKGWFAAMWSRRQHDVLFLLSCTCFFWLLTLHAVLNNEASFTVKHDRAKTVRVIQWQKWNPSTVNSRWLNVSEKTTSQYGIWQDIHLCLMLLSCESFIYSEAFQNPLDKPANQGGLNIVQFLLVPTTLRPKSYKIFKTSQAVYFYIPA